jgi:hypothetical protein
VLELLSNKVAVHPRKQYILDVYGCEPETLDEVAKCVIAVINNCDSGDRYERKSKIEGVKKLKVLGFSWDITYGEASNSHSAPLNGKTNWSGRDKTAPRYYPGWNGRVWIRYDGYSSNAGSEPFERTLTHVGTGGGGGYNGPWEALAVARWKRYGHTDPKDSFPAPQIYSWDYRFYLSDWPMLEDSIRQQRVYDKLAGKPTDMRHKFQWEDTATMIKDAEFLAYCATHPKY